MKKIMLLDLKAQYNSIKRDVDAAIKKVIDSQLFILGKEVEMFEEEVASYCASGYGVGVASGTDAILLALKAAGVAVGDEVITTPFTFMATAEAITNAGARPVFVDIEEKTYNIDPALIEPSITKKTKVILVVHLYGQCVDMDPILELARKRGLRVVEDCAQAIGARYKDKKAASIGDIGCLSFFPSKNLGAFGDGGMVITKDKNIADAIKALRVHGSSRRYYHDMIGYNSRLDNLQAAVLRVKLKHLDTWLDKRRLHAELYNSLLSGVKVTIPFVPEYNIHTYHQYVIAVSDRDGLLDHLSSAGIGTRVYYPVPLHLQKCYSSLGYKKGDLPVSERAADSTLALPVYPELGDEDINAVAGTIKEFFDE